MAVRFTLSFSEKYFVIDGVRSLHLVCTTDEPASEKNLYSFDAEVSSTNGLYSKSWKNVQMPSGKKSVSIPFVPPLEWANDFTTNIGDIGYEKACGLFQATMTAHYTAYAGTLVFENDYTGYAAQIPGGVADKLLPTVGDITAEAVDGLVPAEWQTWVQGKSIARVTASHAAGSYGSKIISWRFGRGQEQADAKADIALKESGAVTIPVTVTDSRLRTATADILLQVEAYQPPNLTQITSFRCHTDGTPAENGTAFLPRYKLKFSEVAGRNVPSVICRWKKVTEQTYGMPQEPIAGQPLDASLEAETSYNVKYTVSDAFTTIDYYDYISSTVYLLHFMKGGTGIAVGKAAEANNLFDVGLESSFRRDVAVEGNLAVTGGMTLGGTDIAQALTDLGNMKTTQVLCRENFTGVTENTVLKCGRMVFMRLCGLLKNGENPPFEGQEYPVADLPNGFYSEKYLPLVVALQNNLPCKGYVTQQGAVYVVPAQTGLQNTEIFTVGIV